MTDYPQALAAARKRVEKIIGFRQEILDDDEIALRDLIAALDAQVPKHSTQDCYEHFLAYSGLEDSPWIKYAYFHGADVGVDRPSIAAPVAPAAAVPDDGEARVLARCADGIAKLGGRAERALFQQPIAPADAVPEGWSIRRDGDEIRVTAPKGIPGGITITPADFDDWQESEDLPLRLLYSLAAALAERKEEGDK
ncbi:MAG: hypothetical protein ACRCTI_16065 [Beijerinckiaceae bacterium]